MNEPGHIEFLFEAKAERTLRELATTDLAASQRLRLVAELRRRFTPEQSRLLLEVALARQALKGRLTNSEVFFALTEAAQQASASAVASWRSQRLHALCPPGPVVELGCGLGADTIELARLRPVVAFESDPVRLRLAQKNVEVANCAHPVEWRLQDWTAQTLPEAGAFFIDPVRRKDGRRILDPEKAQPPLSWLLKRFEGRRLLVKTAPGLEADELAGRAEIEYISLEGKMREAALWWGFGQTGVRATKLTPELALTLRSEGGQAPVAPFETPCFLHEPDVAALRAGAVAQLCGELEGHLLHPDICYIHSRLAREHPWVDTFECLQTHPYKPKRLAKWLRRLQIGSLEIKKRGLDVDPAALRRQLKLKGDRSAVLILTRTRESRLAILAQRARKISTTAKRLAQEE